MGKPAIVVIIAAYNAQATIARAVKSALAAQQVAEVLVIDDCSTDDTSETARQAGLDDPRLRVLEQSANQGPSAARNRAIRESNSPLIAILDADDYLMADRFDHILEEQDWDLCADSLVFFSDRAEIAEMEAFLSNSSAVKKSFTLDFEQFVMSNISQRKRVRGELGFLKPVIRRSFLEKYGLFYDENCRLGEDFILYTRALANGARFTVIDSCGYAALVRSNSLSGNHGVSDLKVLHECSVDLLATLSLSATQRECLEQHASSIKRRIVHREVLEVRHQKGLVSGIVAAAANPTAITDIFFDRITPSRPTAGTPRKLLTAEVLAQYCQ